MDDQTDVAMSQTRAHTVLVITRSSGRARIGASGLFTWPQDNAAQHSTAQHRIASHRIASHRIASHRIAWRHNVANGLVSLDCKSSRCPQQRNATQVLSRLMSASHRANPCSS
ncbi:hypothetical protein CSUB01_04802 [Colletotrichum sublineola]|uniref:Uncharacterized protein n=1 Tax=Colletotrichum sublineola TaxID=1173701 RepID=A0A066WW36_COLSU|nr:hypothetical protein CSUB01_04802 [Colletotrichum sublineola]